MVVGGRVIGEAMTRSATDGTFRANVNSRGLYRDKIKPGRPLRHDKIGKILPEMWPKSTFTFQKTGPKVIENNSSPGLPSIERASGVDVAHLTTELI